MACNGEFQTSRFSCAFFKKHLPMLIKLVRPDAREYFGE